MNIRKTLAAAVAAAAILTGAADAATEQPEMKCQKGWDATMQKLSHPQNALYSPDRRSDGTLAPRISCNARQCMRGYFSPGMSAFELFAEDRTTVIGHYFCGSPYSCFSFDTGMLVQQTTPNGQFVPTRPMPEMCEKGAL